MGYRLVDKQLIYDGKRVRLEVRHFEDDRTGRRISKEVCVHPGAVVILPFLDAETILLIRNRRVSIDETLTELPAGTLEKNEDPINCAGRELVEETGHLAGRLKAIGTLYPSPGVLSERMYLFAAYDLEPARANPDEGEEIEVVPTKWADAIEQIGAGEIVDGKTIATILKYERFVRGGLA
jgi:ADP-ribose pyrophosphatase